MAILNMQTMFVLGMVILSLSGLAWVESALPTLAENLRVHSFVSHSDGRESTLVEVREYANFQEGSFRWDIKDQDEKSARRTSYFRLMINNKREYRLMDNALIAYNSDTGRCSYVPIQEWPLKDLSRLLIGLSMPKNNLMGINRAIPNRTFLGPASLLRLVYENSASLKLFSQSHDQIGATNEFHFILPLDNWDKSGQLVARLIVTVLADNLANGSGDMSTIVNTTLSQVDATSHLSRITLEILNEKRKQIPALVNKQAAHELLGELFMTDSELVERLTVSYNLIQEHSLSRHTGLEYLAAEVDNPFMMPVGLSCGSFSSDAHLYVKATQFSGQFEADNFEGQYFVAYDEASNHLRYDVLGKSKMIYSLNDHSITYIADDSSGADDAELNGYQQFSRPANSSSVSTRSGEPPYYYDRSHCAQASLIGEPGPAFTGSSPLHNRKKLDSILGVGEAVQLAYLGQTQLPAKDRYGQTASFETITCQVFERDIAYDQLPALIQMHTHLKPSEKSNLSLIYYFVDEINSQTKTSLFDEQLNPYESMWLKRIQLFSRNEFSKYTFSNAQLTFSKSSWSLETVGEDTRNRESRLEHPARTFDTLECWPERNLVQLDVVLKQQNSNEWKEKGLSFEDSRLPLRQVESFEETIMTFIARQLGSQRSQINQFELKPKAADNYESMVVRSKLSFPFTYVHEHRIVGWVESYRPLLLKKQAVMVNHKYLVLPHECSLNLATRLRGGFKFFMLFCPNLGCGTLLVDLSELIEEHEEGTNKSNFHPLDDPKDPPLNLAVYNELCSIHLVRKAVQQQGMVSSDHRAEMLKGILEKAALSVESYQLDPRTKELKRTPYRAQVTKVFVTSSKSLQSYNHDEKIVAGVCFTPRTQPLKYQEPMRLSYGNGSVVIKQLRIDQHHSQAHCRKACILFEACETYSYDHAERLCVLTSILPDLLRDPEITFDNLRVRENECAIYALDQLVRYKRTPAIITEQPADLIQNHGERSNTSLILWHDLGGCARYAHSSSWAMAKLPDEYPLSSFGYMRLKHLCLIYGIEREKFLDQFSGARDRLLAHSADLQKFTSSGPDQLSELEAFELYQANPRQFYTRKFGFSIELTGDTTAVLTRLDNQNFDRCLEACTNKDKDCVALDFCSFAIHGSYRTECYLLHLRSPFAIASLNELYEKNRFGRSVPPMKVNSSKPDQKFTALEEDFYLEGRSEREAVINVKNYCQHYYLSGDNLRLKRLLAQDQKAFELKEPVIYPGSGLDAKPLQQQFELIGFWWIMLLDLFLGLSIGVGIFIIQPSITELITKRQVLQGFRDMSNQRIEHLRQALSRSTRCHQANQSQAGEFSEMVRMG